MENKMGRNQSVFIHKAIVLLAFVFTVTLPINALNAQSSNTEKLKGTLVDAAVSKLNALGAVSYTHLTLPTTGSV